MKKLLVGALIGAIVVSASIHGCGLKDVFEKSYVDELLNKAKQEIEDAVSEESVSSDASEIETADSEEPKEETSEPETEPETETKSQESTADASGLVDGMRPEFKEAMDSYEEFYNQYCDFMVKYSENPTDLALVLEYADMMKKAVDVDEKFEAWEDGDLNNEELKYYIDVNSRISQKLLDATA